MIRDVVHLMFIRADVQYLEVDESWRERFAREFGEKAARHLHFADGFTISAIYQKNIIGYISTYWSHLPFPLANTLEAYIDILEVTSPFRRHGVASKLVALTIQRAVNQQVYQVRAWSSEDKSEILPMWKKLGFGLCPAVKYHQDQEIHGFYVTKILG